MKKSIAAMLLAVLVASSNVNSHEFDRHGFPSSHTKHSHEKKYKYHNHKDYSRYEDFDARIDKLSRKNKKLKKRVKHLELELAELYSVINEMRVMMAESTMSRNNNRFACSISTPFDGTFFAKGESKLEAKSKVLQKCEARATGRTWCTKKKVTCEKQM